MNVKECVLNRIDVALSLSEESREALRKLNTAELRRLSDEIEEVIKNKVDAAFVRR